jgi:two-component sensor histidine kinase
MTSWVSFGAEEWPSGLLILHAVSDGIIALSLLTIPVALLYIQRRRGESSPGEKALVTLFALFIFGVGLVHLAALARLWVPDAGLEGLLKAVAALLALTTAIVIWKLAPQLLRLPSRDRLQALRGSPISVFSQDRKMHFTWVHNAPTGLSPEGMIGKTDAEVLPPEAATAIMAAKQKTMATGKAQELETDFELFGRKRSFYLLIEALRDANDAVIGTTSVAVDVSERKANEDQLRLLLRELTHRCKNLLAVIHAIARQTASRTRSVDDFLDRFSARLAAIGCSHDLLIADDWHGASLRMLVEQQLGEHADRFGEQIAIEGEDVMLKPEAVQNLGLALHELAANAEKYGSLSDPEGQVSIRWKFCEDTSKLKLVWQEKGGPPVTPPQRSGFGRAMIETVVGRALEGDVSLSFPPKGVRCEIVIPSAQVTSRG